MTSCSLILLNSPEKNAAFSPFGTLSLASMSTLFVPTTVRMNFWNR